MNPGVVDEAGKAAHSTIDALKSTPVILALVIFNILYMGGTFWISLKNGERFERMLQSCYDNKVAGKTSKEPYRVQSDESTPYEMPPKEEPK